MYVFQSIISRMGTLVVVVVFAATTDANCRITFTGGKCQQQSNEPAVAVAAVVWWPLLLLLSFELV